MFECWELFLLRINWEIALLPMPIQITNLAGEIRSEVQVLREYFGMKPDQKLQDFMNECKALTPEAKTELATGAAKELGYTVTEVAS